MSGAQIIALKILFLSPGSILGFIAGLGLPHLFGWKPNPFLWLLAAVLNVPTCIFLYSAIFQSNGPATDTNVLATLLIFFWGTTGLGLGLPLWLVLPERVILEATRRVRAIFSAAFWRARRP
jgi:hypothetical protein